MCDSGKQAKKNEYTRSNIPLMGWYVLSTPLMLCILVNRVARAMGRQKTRLQLEDDDDDSEVIDVT